MDLPGQLQSALGSAYRIEREHYANLARWWKDCDPDVAPVRDEAVRALARLSAEPGT
jgi:hypothetical protein